MDDIRMPAWNAALRFLLELVALAGWGMAGHTAGGVVGGWLSWPAAVVFVVASAWAWGRYRVPDDPGPAPVAVAGDVRLMLEAVIFVVGALGLGAVLGWWWAAAFGTVTAFHYLMAPDRFRWMRQIGRAGDRLG